jgi:flagellar M-ring protein FliF
VSQTKSQTQKNGVKVEDISIGIAIDKASFDPGERESVTQLVAYAAGVSPESISVQNFQFYAEETSAGPTEPEAGMNKLILYGGIGAGVLVLGSIIALILLKRRKKKGEEEELAMRPDSREAALNMVFGETEQEVIKPITPVQDVRREEIKQFAKTNPEIAAQMIKSWLRSED